MSKKLIGKVFYYVTSLDSEDVVFYKVLRSTTNTCDVIELGKVVVAQTDYHQFVEPDFKHEGNRKRCKVLNATSVSLEPGKIANLWDGLPIRQIIRIFLTSY